MFEDRRDAGKKLAHALEEYKDKDVLVLAIPRGGVEVGFEVANRLDSKFSLLVTRKLPLPHNPEAGFGAIAEDGSKVLLKRFAETVPEKRRGEIIREQKEEVKRRVEKLRGEPIPKIEGETVILIDDGIAMGSTMRASVKMCRKRGAKKIVVAVPVSSPDSASKIEGMVDKLVVLEEPQFFQAVAQAYNHWHDVQNREVLEVMNRWKRKESEDLPESEKEDQDRKQD